MRHFSILDNASDASEQRDTLSRRDATPQVSANVAGIQIHNSGIRATNRFLRVHLPASNSEERNPRSNPPLQSIAPITRPQSELHSNLAAHEAHEHSAAHGGT